MLSNLGCNSWDRKISNEKTFLQGINSISLSPSPSLSLSLSLSLSPSPSPSLSPSRSLSFSLSLSLFMKPWKSRKLLVNVDNSGQIILVILLTLGKFKVERL